MDAISDGFNVHLCKDADAAIEHGFDKDARYKGTTPLKITDVVLIQKGTVAGNPTVDIVMVDEAGKQYVAMTTGNLIRSLPL